MTATAPTVPGYLVERALGSGAHGHVWLARESEGLRRPVALKVFAPEQRESFTRELEAAGKVEELRRRERVVGLVQALGSGEHEGRGWLALEYLERGSLADRVAREGPLPPAAALELVKQAGSALALLHREGYFHRDVKPANLLVGADGQVKLADFGLARPLDGTLSAAGSPAFAAPEVIAGKPVSGILADVYSLGATLAYLVTGETILPGRPDVFALERRSVPRSLQQAIVAATAAEPRERPQTVEALLLALSKENPESDRGKSRSPDSSSGQTPRGEGMGFDDRTQERRETSTLVTEREDVKVAASPVRCPYCHDSVAAEGTDWVACRSCLARHHAGCWSESRRCAACGHEHRIAAGTLGTRARTLKTAVASPIVWAFLYVFVFAGTGGSRYAFEPICMAGAWACWLGAVILAIVSLVRIRGSAGKYRGRRYAIVGLVLCALSVVVPFVVFQYWFKNAPADFDRALHEHRVESK